MNQNLDANTAPWPAACSVYIASFESLHAVSLSLSVELHRRRLPGTPGSQLSRSGWAYISPARGRPQPRDIPAMTRMILLTH
jgi:hypothetical protein